MLGLGDSHTFNAAHGLITSEYHPHLTAELLRGRGYCITPINLGHSGDDTAKILIAAATVASISDIGIGVIYAGTNDGPGGGPDTTANLIAAGEVLQAKGYSRLIIGIQHYLNFTRGGDTVQAQRADLATLRERQKAAAAALGAQLADFHDFMRGRIIAGRDKQGGASWHVADLDTHLNAYGQTILAECITSVIVSAGWLDA